MNSLAIRADERVPDDMLSWKPHAKAMSLAQLSLHVATIPGMVSGLLSSDEFEVPPRFDQAPAMSTAELVPALKKSVADATAMLNGLDDQSAMAVWRLKRGNTEIMAIPRAAAIRTIMLNHWYHHRGQLSVYLRALDIPLPSIYGPSADENPFG
jgi:uncharacterized damage-inducible protein DinB